MKTSALAFRRGLDVPMRKLSVARVIVPVEVARKACLFAVLFGFVVLLAVLE
jgi:hypothetical protein